MAQIMRYDPFREMTSFRRQMDRLFDDTFRSMSGSSDEGQQNGMTGGMSLALDVREDESQYMVEASMPGMNPDDIDISLDDNVLTISGESQQENEREQGQYHIRERRMGRFSRSLRLPNNVDEEKINANYENGVLKLKLPKTEETKPRRINVQGGGNGQTIEAETSNGSDKQS